MRMMAGLDPGGRRLRSEIRIFARVSPLGFCTISKPFLAG